jgi:hypothetical protein
MSIAGVSVNLRPPKWVCLARRAISSGRALTPIGVCGFDMQFVPLAQALCSVDICPVVLEKATPSEANILHLRGVPWARIGEFVGQRNLSVTADVYSHVLGDETELDYANLLV